MQPNVVTCCGLIAALGRARRQGEREEGYLLWQELFASGQDLDAAAYRTGEITPPCASHCDCLSVDREAQRLLSSAVLCVIWVENDILALPPPSPKKNHFGDVVP